MPGGTLHAEFKSFQALRVTSLRVAAVVRKGNHGQKNTENSQQLVNAQVH